MQWGDVATWVSGVATFGAVVVALLQGRRARIEAREAQKLGLVALQISQEERRDAEAHQARQITTRVLAMHPEALAIVTNTSDEPIAAVRLEAAFLDNVVGPASWTYAFRPTAVAAILDPGGELRVDLEFRDDTGEPLPVDQIVGATVDVSFVDSRGVRWRRWGLVQPRPAPDAAVHREPQFAPVRHTFGRP